MRTTNPDKIIYPAIGATKHDLVEHSHHAGGHAPRHPPCVHPSHSP
jgi:DNA primase